MGLFGTMTGVNLSLRSERFDGLFDGFEFFQLIDVGFYYVHLFSNEIPDGANNLKILT
jgi:hypothetical protein